MTGLLFVLDFSFLRYFKVPMVALPFFPLKIPIPIKQAATGSVQLFINWLLKQMARKRSGVDPFFLPPHP
jgi:hypothetical protein